MRTQGPILRDISCGKERLSSSPEKIIEAGGYGSLLSQGRRESSSRTTLALHPLQLRNQHIQRFREHHAAAYGQPVRDDDAPGRWIKALERRGQQNGVAVILGSIA